MSWTDFIVKFENHEIVGVEWEKAVELSRKYGVLTLKKDQSNLHELEMENPFGIVHFHGNNIDGINMVSIDRPTESEFIRPFIFDLLITFNMILCDQNFTGGVATSDIKEHIPEGTLLDGVKIVKAADEIYS